jgi:tetratricopeptide (TPR) repeat protein
LHGLIAPGLAARPPGNIASPEAYIMQRKIVSLCLAAFLAVGSLAGTPAGAADQEKITNPKIGKPLGEAQEAIKKKQWDVAQQKLDQANAVDKKTSFEQFKINEFLAYVLINQKKYAEAAKVNEEIIASGRLTGTELQERLQNMVRLHTMVKNYAKVVEFGDRWIKGGGTDSDTMVLVSQAHYINGDYKGSVSILQGVVDAAKKAGKTPEENWLQVLESGYRKLEDPAGVAKALEQLVRYYPKAEYWERLLDRLTRQKNSDAVAVNLFRLMLQVNVLKDAGDYVELTQMLKEMGVPAEAERVMTQGYARKAFDTTDKVKADRFSRLQAAVKTAAATDRKNLPQTEKDAQKSTTGQGDVALGMAYASFEQYDKAVEALNRGIQHGGVKDPDQAQMSLGISQLKLGHKSEAAKAFEQIKGDSPLVEVARLWALYAKSNAG